MCNFFIQHFWETTPSKAELLKNIVDLPTTWLSARLRTVAAREAIDMIKSVYERWKDEPSKIKMPVHKGKRMAVSSTIADLQLNRNTTFDAWLHLHSIGNKTIIDIPIKYHKHFNRLEMKGRRLNSYIITTNYVQNRQRKKTVFPFVVCHLPTPVNSVSHVAIPRGETAKAKYLDVWNVAIPKTQTSMLPSMLPSIYFSGFFKDPTVPCTNLKKEDKMSKFEGTVTSMKTLKIWGARRTGTNYLQWLLQNNCEETIILVDTPLWKHLTPSANCFKLHYISRAFALAKTKDFLVSNDVELNKAGLVDEIKVLHNIYCVKNPYSWYLSICKWNNIDAFPLTNGKLQQLFTWNYLNSEYYNNRGSIIKYEDLLHEPETIVKRICFNSRAKLKKEFTDTNLTKKGELFDRKDYYLEKKYLRMYDDYDLLKFNKFLNADLMRKFGYDLEVP